MTSDTSFQVAASLPKPDLHELQFQNEETTRQRVTRWLVVGYLFVVVLSFAPLFTYLVLNGEDLAVSDVTTLSAVTAGAISSLTGLLGFVLGYYFKASETPAAMSVPSRQTRRAPKRP